MSPSENPPRPPAAESARAGAWPLWRNRDYLLLWSGQAVSALGSAMSGVVFPLLALSLTHSPAAAGLAGALYALPYLLLSLPGGALVDRWNRKRVMSLCDAGRALSLASVPIALAFGVLTIWQLYANALIEGALFVFFNIAEVAALPRLVDQEQLPAASGQNEAALAAARLVGPALGGLLYQTVGRGAPFALDALSYAVSVGALLLIRTPFQAARAPAAGRSLRAEIAEGLTWLWRQRAIRFLAFLAGGLNGVFASQMLLLIVLARGLGAGEAAIGATLSAGALGGLLGALLARRVQRAFRLRPLIVGLVWVLALVFPLYAVAPHVVGLGAVTAVLFFTEPIFDVVALSYRLGQIPDALQGRVNSAARLFIFLFQPAGAALGGLLLQQWGGQGTVGILAVVLLGLALWATASPELRLASNR